MYIPRIELINFRNHKHTVANFTSGINVLVGANAQGKTNLLEAIYLSCIGRGWRSGRDGEMILFGEDFAAVQTTVKKHFGHIDIAIKIGGSTKKAISINGVPISKVAELMGQINCVFFSPDELRMIKNAPADRRRFLNIDISQTDKNYFYALTRYNKILSQRNAYLKELPYPASADALRGLSIWDEQLISVGTFLIEKRLQFIMKLTPYLITAHNDLTSNTENIVFSYIICGFDNTEKVINNINNIGGVLRKELLSARDKDLRQKTTTVGPHRDDIKIEINGHDVRTYGSQGQQRTVALSIKLAELRLFADITGEYPVLLLDDVFSELDSSRQGRLLTAISNAQTIITATDALRVPAIKNAKIFRIRNGQID
jgi:DNA replication and repair protein RecF